MATPTERLAGYWLGSGMSLVQARRLEAALDRGEPMTVDGAVSRGRTGGTWCH